MPFTPSSLHSDLAAEPGTAIAGPQAVGGKAFRSAKRMHLMLLTDSFPPHAGGSRGYYHSIYKKLVELGDSRVTVLTKKVPGWEEFDRQSSTELFRIHRRFAPLNSWKYHELPKGILPAIHAAWHMFRGAPAILHAGDLYPPGVIAMTMKRLAGLPYVVYCHGEEITQTDHFRYQPRVRDRIYQSADAVVAASEFARQNLLRIGVREERIRKITPGVDAERFAPHHFKQELARRHGLQGKTVLMTVSRLVPRKGHRLVLQALGGICKDMPNVHYLIVGTGSEEAPLRQMVQEAGLQDRVTFTGLVRDDELVSYYHLCDIMAMPNRQEANGDVEGFGMVFLEANAAGKPVIGGNSGGAPEAIVDGVTGFLVNPNDPEDLASALRKLLQNPSLREQFGRAGAQRVRADYNWESRARALQSLNDEILSVKGTHAARDARALQQPEAPAAKRTPSSGYQTPPGRHTNIAR